MQEIQRPAAPTKKISTKEDFELCLFRHQYFRRAKYNPTEEEMRPYMDIVGRLTKNTFFTYHNLFRSVGLCHEDITNIGRVHLVSFMCLYALEYNKDKENEWITIFRCKNDRMPEAKDYNQKNKANFTLFFKQRMEDVVRVCRQKCRNIKGQNFEEFQVFIGKDTPPKNPRKLLKDFLECGYKKLDFSVFKSIRKKADVDRDATIFKFDDYWYVAIALEQKPLEFEDIVGSEANPIDNTHHLSPEQLYQSLPINSNWGMTVEEHFGTKDEKNLDCFNNLFDKKSSYRKRVILQNFIAKNKDIVHYTEEVETAQKLLKGLGGWIR